MLLERSSCFSGDGLGAAAVELRRCWRRQDWQIFGDCPDHCQERVVDVANFGGNTWPCDYSSHSIATTRHIKLLTELTVSTDSKTFEPEISHHQ